MKKMFFAMLALSAMLCAGGNIAPVAPVVPAVVEKAKTGIYAGVAYTYVDAGLSRDDFFDGSIGSGNAGSLAIGYNVLPYLAVEGRYSLIAEDDFNGLGRVDGSAWSIFAKPQYGFDNGVVVYGLLGAGQVELGDIYTETSFQYGVGVAYNINRDFLAFVDYTKLADDSDFAGNDISVDAINVGVAYKF